MDRPENSAEHIGNCALCALLLEAECAFPVDALHAALMMLMHDVPEIGCGDTFAYANERGALAALLMPLPECDATRLRALWEEFEAGETPEARYANALDRLLPVLHKLSHDGHSWREHGVRLEQVTTRLARLPEVLPGVWALLRPRIEAHFGGEER